ncbi:butyrate kinase, partial [bacterium]|nr:butyrate kinase [bacterium]
VGKGGMIAYLGSNNMQEILQRKQAGDTLAGLVYEAMAYQVAKEIGAMSTVLSGRVDGIVLTGGIAHDTEFIDLIAERVKFIAPIHLLPGEEEMTALCQGALRVLRKEETAAIYAP